MKLLQLNRARLGYNGRPVFEDLSLEVREGQVLGLIGPNGSGKSTILRALCGMLKPRTGRASLNDRNLKCFSREALSREIGVVPQSPLVPETFTVLETVLMGRYSHLGLLRYESERDLEIAFGSMERTGVDSLAERRMGEISGGEKQRVLIARALAQEPHFLLLDEPTSHLDIQHQIESMGLVRSLADSGLGVAAAIHDFTLAGRYCDRLVMLKEGAVFREGPPQEVLTAQNIERVFGVIAFVYGDLASGPLVVHAGISPSRSDKSRHHVHVIAGGGSAAELIPRLYLEGYRLTIGVLNEGDTDLSAARALGLTALAVPPFAPIEGTVYRSNHELAAGADCCVVADVPFGNGNLPNLEAAAAARRLILVNDTPIEQRDFTGGEASILYKRLAGRASITSSGDLPAALTEALSSSLQARI